MMIIQTKDEKILQGVRASQFNHTGYSVKGSTLIVHNAPIKENNF